jgi:hypothetical protein
MTGAKRRIGPIGTSLRVLVAAGLLYLAGGAQGLSWSVTWYDAAVGLAGFPALTVLLGLAARRHAARSIRLTGPLAHALNCALILALATNPYTGDAVSLFYGAALLGAAWRAQPGCEVTVLSNWILHRDDQVGCPLFGPIDAAEARHSRRPLRPLSAHD